MADKIIDLAEAGFKVDARVMENAEKRYRFEAPDGSAYIRTEMDAEGEWQNAHHHKGLRETYIVQRGWIAAAERNLPNRTTWSVVVFSPGEVFTSEPATDHNIFMPRGAVIHTVKHGTPVPNPAKKSGADWYEADQEFDQWTKTLTVKMIAERRGFSEEELNI